jgi:hypothetical protein
VPSAVWNSSGWTPNSTAAQRAAALMAGAGERVVAVDQRPVGGAADERHDDRHVEGLGPVGQDAAVAEEERLDQQGGC